ncbi:Papain-like cysteine protease AvrRpt2 [Polaribacter sp. KT25b]|uniref:papain-like cysteine protease family protein n=1 Tax=Polaribacter sp. KT25b TaxID=1855336 RepID=UPI00087DA566|nr:papain-like cysteine protease family protein [Polaribacter sp. KT25b]SDR94153.1 Papain-like cysteine protease AvrRpt2 [Polaribacter sp. KT25b]
MKKVTGIIILMFIGINLNAQSCKQYGNNYFGCGVPTNEFEYMRATSVNGGSQMQSNWCWAACIQMTLNYHGLYVSQVDVVRKIYGFSNSNRPANERQILNALSGWAADNRGRFSSINAYGGYTSVQEIISGLSKKWPLIVGLSNSNGGIGHAYVMTGIYYSNRYDNFGNVIGIIPDKVVLRDPWPLNDSRQEMSWNEFQRRAFMGVKVWVNRM